MESLRARLKFSDDLPPQLECHLVSNCGFRMVKRQFDDHVIFDKIRPFTVKESQLPVLYGQNRDLGRIAELTPTDKVRLGRGCQMHKEKFYDIESNRELIKFRIREMCRPLPNSHKQWCEDWIRRNLDEV